ncbi:hypothetical protein [Ammoniphilus sp. YIM 78166]|uniref:hypothetical protein n=1 Tax=Ammoniphilus sp. YIM 78166 TaxID=1644106 RepID=UPI00106F3605|nr:hypothetical protein [Ammoniphilus sp. YIM 78166]
MILAKMILYLLNQHEILDTITLADALEDTRIDERLTFLRSSGYINEVGKNEYEITPKGRVALRKI